MILELAVDRPEILRDSLAKATSESIGSVEEFMGFPVGTLWHLGLRYLGRGERKRNVRFILQEV
jgi:hypothetical protein